MLQLLAKLLLFAAFFFLLKSGLWFYLHQTQGPQSFRHEGVLKREVLLKPIAASVNTVFIGSSRTAFSIDPVYFDALTHQRTCSFNHGILGFFAPNTFAECRQILRMPQLPVKYILMELGKCSDLYYHDPLDNENPLQELLFQTYFVLQNPEIWYSEESKLMAIYNSFLFKLFAFDVIFKDLVSPITNASGSAFMGDFMDSRGFRYFLQATKAKTWHVKKTVEPITDQKESLNIEAYQKELKSLIEDGEKRKIAIYFCRPNIMSAAEQRLYEQLSASLPSKNVLNLTDCTDWPTTQPSYLSADEIHLSRTGARAYTKLLAESFNRIQGPEILAKK